MSKLQKLFYFLTLRYEKLLPKEIPSNYRKEAAKQWRGLVGTFFIKTLLTYFPMGILVALTSRPTENAFGEREAEMSPKYVAKGASGKWEYEASPYKWLDNYNILEDSVTGEPSGKHSAACNNSWWGKLFYGGKYAERSFIGKYLYICRNPFNKGKRTNEDYACFVDDCELEYFGDKHLTDRNADPESKGWYFVKAVDSISGNVYYGYREVNLLNKQHVEQMTLGFKIKPEHAYETQDIDDKDKAFTMRYQMKSDIN